MSMKDDKLTRLKRNASRLLQKVHEQTRAQQRRLSTNGRCRSACDQLDARVRRRLASFTPVKWAGKPGKLSPLVFASHGWVCISSDMVKCEACGQYMSVLIPSLVHVDISVYQKSVRMLVSMVTMKHYVTCPYRYTSSGTCDASPLNVLSKDIVNQRYVRVANTRMGVANRQIMSVKGKEHKVDFQSNERRYETMKKLDFENIEVDISEVPSTVALETAVQKCKALICFGWQRSKYLDDAVVCTYCSRTVGLWLLRGHFFDVERQHHNWCIFAPNISRHTDGWQCRHFVLQCINSSKDLPITSWAAKAEVWKSTIIPRNIPSLT